MYNSWANQSHLRMAHGAPQVLNLDTTVGQQAVANGEPHLTNNVQLMAKQKVVVPVYAATQGILERQYRPIS